MSSPSLSGIKSIFTDEDKKSTRNKLIGSLAALAGAGAGALIYAKMKKGRRPNPMSEDEFRDIIGPILDRFPGKRV